MNKVVLLCRPGFEKECAAEITDKAGQREIFGFARVKENAGYVIYDSYLSVSVGGCSSWCRYLIYFYDYKG